MMKDLWGESSGMTFYKYEKTTTLEQPIMERLIQKISKDIDIVYDQGWFDEWCVYIKDGNTKTAPKDVEYFNFFVQLGKKYTCEKVYADFVEIYNLVSENIEKKVLDKIIDIAKKTYDSSISKDVAINFTVVYAGMVAERNKAFTVLKERIKRLGIHQILLLDYKAEVAANFSKEKKAKDLDIICKEYGF